MEYDDAGSVTAAELEEELYSRIHHDKPDAHEILSEAHYENSQLKKAPIVQQNRSVSKHSIVNNSKMNKKMSKNRKKASEKFNPNPFAIASAINNQIQMPKRFTPYTSYLSQVDSRPIDLPPAPMISNLTKVEENVNDQRVNPFNCGFNRAEEKMKRYQLMQAKKAQADKIRQNIQDLKNVANDNKIDEGTNDAIEDHPKSPKIVIDVADSDSDDEVYIYPPEPPTVISSDDDENSNVNEEIEAQETIDNLQDDCDEINVDYETRLSRHDDPFGGIDVAELNAIVLENPVTNVQPLNDSTDHFAKPQRANRQSLKRSYEVSETDFPATDVYESESSDLPECNVRDNGKKMSTILSESDGSDIDTTTKRSKRMRKRKSSGSNRGSDCFSSDDSDADDDNFVEHEKSNRTYLLRGEGVYNAITKFPKRTIDTQRKPDRDIDAEADDSSDDSLHNDEECDKDNFDGNWKVTDEVGETDNIDLDLSTLASLADASLNNEEIIESNVDKDDDNCVRSKRLVIHPEMGWNKEMSAFYNDSWGGETHNALAIRREMPRSSLDWRIDPRDLKESFNVLKIKCHNCRENGHRQAFCPQPKKEVICYTCGEGGHREVRCPHAMCLKCGEKTNTYRRGCERCFRVSHVSCKKCHRRGHYARDCPDNWRAYHNTRANRQSLKRSYEVSETDFPATDVYESESSDLPECNVRDNGKKMSTILSESDGSDIDTTTKRSKRMRKRKSSGSNRGSDCFSSDDSDADDDNFVEHEKSNRTYLLRGEGVYNAITKFPKRTIDTQRKPDRDIDAEADDSSDDSLHNDEECDKDNFDGNWKVTDEVGETDNIDLDLSTLASLADASLNNEEIIESNVDKDDDNCVRSKRLVIHPEMGWNKEMSAFYNDSWGGETHNALAIRREMPRSSLDWRIDPRDLKESFNVLKIKCHNCRENGHRQAFCPQPKKEVICYTCGEGGHREVRCPHAMCLKCGEKTNTYRRGCERCFRVSHVSCKKCHRRGHYARDCPDNWRAYHNTTDPVSTPVRLPTSANTPKKYCSACAAYGHRADQCYNFRIYLQDDVIPSDIRQYKKVYFDEAPIDNSMSTPYSLFENPRENFAFKWNVNESSDRVYGRFLAATKVERDIVAQVVKRKQKKIQSLMDITVEDPFEKLVLNPMNAQNIREKPKKQFSKNFYEESAAARAQNKTEEASNEFETNDNSVTGADNSVTDAETNVAEYVDPCNDVEMVDLEGTKTVSNDTSKDCDNSNVDLLDKYKLTEEAIEVDQLQETNIFSFTKEIEELEKSKSSFDLSFIGSITGDNQEVDNSSTITKSTERKIRTEAEIERLTEMEISLKKLKKELNKKKPKSEDIVLNTTNSTDHSVHCVHDSDSNYSFGEYFNESTSKQIVDKCVEKELKRVEQEPNNAETELPDYIPLSQDVDALDTMEESCTLDDPPEKPVSEAKIFLTKEHARLLLSTEAGNKLLSNASSNYHVKVRMDFENLGNVLVVTGSKLNQNKFHADLIRFLVDVCKKMRLRNETFQQIPRGKVALIRFIRENFALLDQPLGNPTELYKNMRRNEKLQSKNGIKNADRARKNLNIILMGRAGLLDGRFHLDALEDNLRFLLENNKDMITKQTREEIYQHYRYIFSPYEHDDYPELISKYEELKKSKKFPPLNIDKSLLELKITVNDGQSVELNRAKQKLMQLSNPTESPKMNKEPTGQQETTVILQEPKTPTRELRPQRREPKTPRSLNSPKLQPKNMESTDVSVTSAVEDPSNVNKNAIWSLKCKDIVEKCREKHIKSSKVVDKLNTVLEKASKNQLSHGDYKNLEKILNTLNRTVN